MGAPDETAYAIIAKAREEGEKRFTLGIAYPANRIDGHGDYTTPEELERAAWTWLAEHRQIGLQHQDGTTGHGVPVESYIYRGPDWEINGVTVHAGDWLLGVVWDEAAWALIKSGVLTGYSIQGRVRPVPASEEEVASLARSAQAQEEAGRD